MKTEYDQIDEWLEEVRTKVNKTRINQRDKNIINSEIRGIQWWTIENMIKKIVESKD